MSLCPATCMKQRQDQVEIADMELFSCPLLAWFYTLLCMYMQQALPTLAGIQKLIQSNMWPLHAGVITDLSMTGVGSVAHSEPWQIHAFHSNSIRIPSDSVQASDIQTLSTVACIYVRSHIYTGTFWHFCCLPGVSSCAEIAMTDDRNVVVITQAAQRN